MQTVATLEMLRNTVGRWRSDGRTVALVPTMGALHPGHLALMAEARRRADRVVASIFVNPTQFGPGEDFEAYPRDEARDTQLLKGAGVDLLWLPDAATMYPEGFATTVSVKGLGEDFCGAARPGHFNGVATVVAKLFQQVAPDCAVFGEKDFQQLAIIRRMARDLDFAYPAPAAIHGLPTVREADGLARSSRNRYLSQTDRGRAAELPAAIGAASEAIAAGADVGKTLASLTARLRAGGFDPIDYAALADASTLERLERWNGQPARILVAAKLGTTRLIDNAPVGAADRD